MSEYQYYEFQAIDRPLSKQQMAELRAISSRAEITPTRFTNSYSYGDFRGNPVELIERYFDAHVYIANWGSHVLIFGISSKAIDVDALRAYQAEGGFAVQERRGRVIVTIESQPEESTGDWIDEGEGASWMSALVGLRADLMNGDLRAAYLGWLRGLQAEGVIYDEEDLEEGEEPEPDRLEPPVPPGLGTLSGSLQELVTFLEIDQDLLAVAAEASEPLKATGPSAAALKRWIAELPNGEKDEFLLRLLQGDAQVPAELRRRFREARPSTQQASATKRRTVGELYAAMQARAAERTRQEREATEKERKRKADEAARARQAHLNSMVGQEAGLWHRVEVLVGTKKPTDYDRAVVILADLRDLGAREGTTAEFQGRLHALRRDHSSKPSFIKRLDEKRLV